jgi:UDP-glucose 4-epimerase
LVFASSVKAVGERNDTPWTEAVTPRPVDPYGASKLEAEVLLRGMAASGTFDVPILRLPLLYGPGLKANMRRLFEAVARRRPLPLALVRNRRSFAYVGNVIAAMDAVIAAGSAGSATFFVSDGHDLSTPELARLIAAALGVEPRLLPVPPALLRAAGRAGDLLARVGPFPLTSAAVDRLLGSLVVDVSLLRATTGWRPQYTVEEGLAVTAQWFRARGGLDRPKELA